MRKLTAFAVGSILYLAAALSLAAPPDPCDAGAKPRVRATRGPDGRLRMVLEDPLIICGKRHRPQAFYVLQRSTIDYQPAPLRRSFVPRIDESVRHDPF